MRDIAISFFPRLSLLYVTLIHLVGLSSSLPASPERQSASTDDSMDSSSWGSHPYLSLGFPHGHNELSQPLPNQIAYQMPQFDPTRVSQQNMWQLQHHSPAQPFHPSFSQTIDHQTQHQGVSSAEPLVEPSHSAWLQLAAQEEAERFENYLNRYRLTHQAAVSATTFPTVQESVDRDKEIVKMFNELWTVEYDEADKNAHILIYQARHRKGKHDKWGVVHRPTHRRLIGRVAKVFGVDRKHVQNLVRKSKEVRTLGGKTPDGKDDTMKATNSGGKREHSGQLNLAASQPHRFKSKGKGKKQASLIDRTVDGSDKDGEISKVQEDSVKTEETPQQDYDHMGSIFTPTATGNDFYFDPLDPYKPLYSPQIDYSQNERDYSGYYSLHPPPSPGWE